ncbi:hypothetical protein F4860DRAFT_330328 [Xylaria cubensis]|nr:hypothetical protein F4860DRAFT_330328 [Xylaria cubensis]
MTSQPDSSSSATAGYDPFDCFDDVVGTQGAYLITHPGTPVFQESHDDQFVAELARRLHMTLVGQRNRRQRYHEAADEWRVGFTPPEVRERHRAEYKALLRREGFGTDSSDNDSDGCEIDKDKGGSDINAQVGPGKPVATPDRPKRLPRPRQAHCLPSPPSSAESSLATTHKRKRCVSSDEEEEKEHPAKKQIGFVQEPSTTQQQKSRKRRRSLDVSDEEGGRERSGKVRVVDCNE